MSEATIDLDVRTLRAFLDDRIEGFHIYSDVCGADATKVLKYILLLAKEANDQELTEWCQQMEEKEGDDRKRNKYKHEENHVMYHNHVPDISGGPVIQQVIPLKSFKDFEALYEIWKQIYELTMKDLDMIPETS